MKKNPEPDIRTYRGCIYGEDGIMLKKLDKLTCPHCKKEIYEEKWT